jgi:hypothetical protein
MRRFDLSAMYTLCHMNQFSKIWYTCTYFYPHSLPFYKLKRHKCIILHSRAKSMNEITITLWFSNTHTIYPPKRSKFSKFSKIYKFLNISNISKFSRILWNSVMYVLKCLDTFCYAHTNILVLYHASYHC